MVSVRSIQFNDVCPDMADFVQMMPSWCGRAETQFCDGILRGIKMNTPRRGSVEKLVSGWTLNSGGYTDGQAVW